MQWSTSNVNGTPFKAQGVIYIYIYTFHSKIKQCETKILNYKITLHACKETQRSANE
jgi:hypothetical protein